MARSTVAEGRELFFLHLVVRQEPQRDVREVLSAEAQWPLQRVIPIEGVV